MFRLTRRSEYGLMALAFLARGQQQYTSVRTIVEDLQIPRRLLAEVLKDLSRARLVEAVRGPGGGYRLTMPADKLTLARAVEVLEGPSLVSECSDAVRRAMPKSRTCGRPLVSASRLPGFRSR